MRRYNRVSLPIRIATIVASFALVASFMPALMCGDEAIANTDNAASTTSQTAPVATTSDDYTKTEVVYAKLSATGQKEGIYVVNTFDSTGSGACTDYGAYTSLTNLTDEQDLTLSEGAVNFERPEGRYYYQGDLATTTDLPWIITISYKLDGTSMSADEIAGGSGKLTMQMVIKPDTKADATFADNYLLQISGTFPGQTTGNITAADATIAQSGTDTAVTFMLLPGQSATYTITADVTDFSFDGFQISGVPLSFALDLDNMGDLSSMTSGITTLKSAISALNDGTGSLVSGSEAIQSGLDTIAAQNGALTSGSSQIASGLSSAADGTSELADGLGQIADGASQTASGSAQFLAGLEATANQDTSGVDAQLVQAEQEYTAALTTVYTNPQMGSITQADIDALNTASQNLASASGNNGGVYGSKQTAQGFYDGYASIDGGVQSLSTSLASVADSTSELASGLGTLDEEYALFDSGLVAYTDGVSTLASNYSIFGSGISSLAEGTSQLTSQTATLDTDIINGIKDELKNYLNADFTPTSFVDSRNTNIKQVQFVMMTESISYTEPEEPVAQEETTTFWERFVALFS